MDNKKVLAIISKEDAEKLIELDSEINSIIKMQDALVSRMSSVNCRKYTYMKEIAKKCGLDPLGKWRVQVDTLEIIEGIKED